MTSKQGKTLATEQTIAALCDELKAAEERARAAEAKWLAMAGRASGFEASEGMALEALGAKPGETLLEAAEAVWDRVRERLVAALDQVDGATCGAEFEGGLDALRALVSDLERRDEDEEPTGFSDPDTEHSARQWIEDNGGVER